MIIDRINAWRKKPAAIAFLIWIKQPSTIKAIVIFAGLVGVGLDPERVQTTLTTAAIIYGAIAAFWQKS